MIAEGPVIVTFSLNIRNMSTLSTVQKMVEIQNEIQTSMILMGINVSVMLQYPDSKYCQFCVNLSQDSVGRKGSMSTRRQTSSKVSGHEDEDVVEQHCFKFHFVISSIKSDDNTSQYPPPPPDRYTIGTHLGIMIEDYISSPAEYRNCARYTHSYGALLNQYVYQKLDRDEIVSLNYNDTRVRNPYSQNYESIQFAFTPIIIPMNMKDYRRCAGEKFKQIENSSKLPHKKQLFLYGKLEEMSMCLNLQLIQKLGMNGISCRQFCGSQH